MFHIRRYFSTGLIVLLSLVAAMAIYVLVTGEIGWGEIKALLTALIGFAVGLNAVTCLTCRHEVRHVWYVWVGVALGILCGLMLMALLWFDIPVPHYWQICSVTLTWTLIYTHCLLPVLIRLEGWKQVLFIPLTRGSAILLGGLLSFAIISQNYGEWLVRTLSVLIILLGFFTLLLVILHRRNQGLSQRLVLYKSEDGTFRDATGRYYQVTPVE